MAENEEKKKVQVGPVLREYAKVTARYPGYLAIGVISTLVVEGAAVTSPWYLKQFIDQLSSSTPTDAVVAVLLGIIGLYAAVQLVRWAGRRVLLWSVQLLEAGAMADLSNQAFTHLLKHSHDFFQSNFSGSLTRRVSRYARSYEPVYDSIIFNFLSTILYVGGVIAVLSQRSLLLGMVLLGWTVVFVVVQLLLTRWRQPLRVARAEADTKQTGVLSDSITNQSTVSLFAASGHEYSLFGNVTDTLRKATLRSWRADLVLNAVQSLLATAIEIALLVAAVFLWQKGVITIGDFVLLQVYILGLVEQVWGIGNVMRRLYDAFADAFEMVEILNTPYEVKDIPEARPLAVSAGVIAFQNVDFNFNATRAILKNLSLLIQAGEKVALVGPSGAGKSTVTKLILRLYDVTAGHILIDGQDIAKVTQDSLRAAIAFVPQEPILFHRSLMDNIRYGRIDATDAEVIAAAKQAHCHEFIDALPEKYETFVGERGVKLSGGERQRVAIARAILKNAPILILDEATSSLDSESEALIQDALSMLMKGKTVIIIAHRLSTIINADRILVMQDGAIIAQGTHLELLKEKSGLYQKLWSIQAGGFLKEE